MKSFLCATALLVCAASTQAIVLATELPATTASESGDHPSSGDVAEADLPFPEDMECVPQPVYRHRADGKPGREVTLNFKAANLSGKAQVEVTVDGQTETTELPDVAGGAGWPRSRHISTRTSIAINC
jgi:hypothetical protein